MILPESNIKNSGEFYDEVRIRWSYISNHLDEIYKEILGVDIFDYSFDKEKGYSIIKKGNLEILIYTLESLSAIGEEAISSFLGIPNFKLIRANEAKKFTL